MYRDEFAIIAIADDAGKRWVYIRSRHPDQRIFISFRHIYELLRLVINCEREKYGQHDLPAGRDPAALVRRFLSMAASDAMTWAEIERLLNLTKPITPPNNHPTPRERSTLSDSPSPF